VDIRNASAAGLVPDLIATINANRAYLSEIDGAIGDGDHGINMSKGFTAAGERLKASPPKSLGAALGVLGETLVEGVGGSMGPLYGNFFLALSESLGDKEFVDPPAFSAMLGAGLLAIQEIGSAKVGDKTLLDALVPGRDAFDAASKAGKGFAEALSEMAAAADRGRDSTKDMVAKVGRASRLGERSRGVLDAGATSCALLLGTMAKTFRGAMGAA
jgi:dihydroxyacetone kinase phosphoprotein-dependent L subunit